MLPDGERHRESGVLFKNTTQCPRPRVHLSKLPVITRPIKLFCFPFQMGVPKVENYTVKLLAIGTKSTSLEVRTHPTFLETDFKI